MYTFRNSVPIPFSIRVLERNQAFPHMKAEYGNKKEQIGTAGTAGTAGTETFGNRKGVIKNEREGAYRGCYEE